MAMAGRGKKMQCIRRTLCGVIVPLLAVSAGLAQVEDAARGLEGRKALAEIQARDLEFTAHEFVSLAGAGEIGLVSLFLQAGMPVEAADRHGRTALIAAAFDGMTDVVALLLDAGADPDATDEYRASALLYAASEGYRDIVGELLTRGASVDLSDTSFGRTPLMLAALEGYADLAADLLAAGANIDAQSIVDHNTALMLAASRGRDEVVSVLLKHRCDRKKKDRLGRTAEDLARQMGFARLARRIKAGR